MVDSVILNSEIVHIYNVRNFPYSEIPTDYNFKDHNNRKKRKYRVEFGTFDIETTSVIEETDETGHYEKGYGYMYVWQFCTAGMVCMGRTWDEFVTLLSSINLYFARTGTNAVFIIYVHNLAFEFQFMHGMLNHCGISGDVFATNSRKVLTYRLHEMEIEFRCSMKLTNRSLQKYLSDFPDCGLAKMTGDLDYKIKRTPKTELDEKELCYCIVDVLGLYRALKLDMKKTGDDTATIPLTSTGYVRRDLKRATKRDRKYRKLVEEMALTDEQYFLVERLKKGGDTLASLSNEIGKVHENVLSFDFVSEYPARLVISKYPYGKLSPEDVKTVKDIEGLEKEGRYYILEFIADQIELVNPCQPIPCVSAYKTDFAEGTVEYNGRILKAEKIGAAMDMPTFQLFRKQYTFKKITFGLCFSCGYRVLPDILRRFVLSHFMEKCRIKDNLTDMKRSGLAGTDEYVSMSQDYMLCKNRFNGIFGMLYTNPLHDKFLIKEGGHDWKHNRVVSGDEKIIYVDEEGNPVDNGEDLSEELHRNQIKAVGAYLWGVHTASMGRVYLSELIDSIGYENQIYSDTDSVKCKDTEKARSGVAVLNKRLLSEAMDAGAVCDTGKNVYYLGLAENETDDGPYQEFCTLGAKKYIYRDGSGLHMTLSGVRKEEVMQLHDDIKNFHSGFVFNPAGGITLHYNDRSPYIQHVVGDDGTECDVVLASNICCTDRVITLGYIIDDRAEKGWGGFISDLVDMKSIADGDQI